MIELFEKDLKQDDRQSSKGNQLKWKNDGISWMNNIPLDIYP